ncbi:polysaccharide pyruvyl transferase [Calothrix sp. NIES-4071]|nr:polysaccharide pyruvyl transferase [Calothrix sp. NIES-4071]BAZ59449.1 polysaccharide pyruvyl transferase [Calothrix sp. NIES-4105]
MLANYASSLITENITNSAPEKLKELLHQALGKLEPFEQCALLDYPDHPNIGDNLIWLGEVFYLTDVLKTKINYAASHKNFSEAEMEKQVGKAPILLHGGGNLGDLWPEFPTFRQHIISKYQDRPIIILPQSIYFREKANLIKAAKVFNSHPNLTLFVRDNYSYEIAIQHFSNCQIIKAPDMALQMVNMPGLSFNYTKNHSILYHCRNDKELNQTSSPASIDLPNLVVEDWTSYKYDSQYYKELPSKWAKRMALISSGLQQGTVIPTEWISRQLWKHFHPYASKFNNLYNPSMHLKSWSYMHHGIYQFKQHRLIITNRLHGHILCILMGIPHIFLPNAYYKNEAFYETWTYSIPFCRFVKDPSQIKGAAQELLDLFSN